MRLLLLAGFLLLAGMVDPRADPPLALDGDPVQGGFLVGHAKPGDRLGLDGEPVTIGADGLFVIGFGRDQAAKAELTIRHADGQEETIVLAVAQREYEIQHIENLDPNMVEPDAATSARIAAEQKKVAAARALISDERGFLQNFIWPASGRISGVYGSQRILNNQPKAPHYGIDIAAPEGTPVFAPASGIVRLAEPDFYLTGGTILIDHGFGIGTNFLHLKDIVVKVGDRVAQGDLIGHVGMTGRATGPHLHWGMTWGRVRLDPALRLPSVPAGGTVTAPQ